MEGVMRGFACGNSKTIIYHRLNEYLLFSCINSSFRDPRDAALSEPWHKKGDAKKVNKPSN
jgi:hypothetical protein